MERLDLVALLRRIRESQERLVLLADTQGAPVVANDATLSYSPPDYGLPGRPGSTANVREKPKLKRGRRRPDPVLAITEQLHDWYRAEPWRTAGELLDRAQESNPGEYPDKLPRTVQRRIRSWRAEEAHRMVFGPRAGLAEI